MEFALWVEKINQNLEQWTVFRGFKFILAFQLVIMGLAIILLIRRLIKFGYYNLLTTGQEHPVVKWRFAKKWEKKVASRMNSNNPDYWKAAILEAATFLNQDLKTIGYPGETLGEQLDNLTVDQIDNLEELKEANEVKNKIIKDGRFNLSREEANKVINIFKKALELTESIAKE